ncbi:chromatin binding [Homalodisca vitripennis]|nr:chromatin binding [Homalodisca vitripennis]
MADHDTFSGQNILKNSKIVVNVEEALQDVLVVTYASENKLFQGVLLDSTKRFLPCGITPPPELLNKKTENTDDDKFYSVSQRFTYFQEKPNNPINGGLLPHLHPPKPKPNARLKPPRMTVRLRPRQVLCSKCRSICNENSENVDHSKNSKRNSLSKENDNQNNEGNSTRNVRNLRPTLIPKLNRLEPNEINNAINGKVVTRSNIKCNLIRRPSKVWLNPSLPTSPINPEPAPPVEEAWTSPRDEDDKEDEFIRDGEDSEGKMVLRKKRSVGSMEDLWDENVFVEATKKARTTPVIKISFGSQGEGTVLKIPAKVQNCSESEPEEKHKTASAKAAKRALKKAKKEARRKLSHVTSPGASPAYEALHYRRHRHKVKHKKKHKEDRPKDSSVYTDMKERCLKQKLSISLRRLNANAYAHRSDSGLNFSHVFYE